jgi:hypothetical protein
MISSRRPDYLSGIPIGENHDEKIYNKNTSVIHRYCGSVYPRFMLNHIEGLQLETGGGFGDREGFDFP